MQEIWWSPYLDSNAISVTVDDGIATLRGTVDTWLERRRAELNAYDGGARAVRNLVTVEGVDPDILGSRPEKRFQFACLPGMMGSSLCVSGPWREDQERIHELCNRSRAYPCGPPAGRHLA